MPLRRLDVYAAVVELGRRLRRLHRSDGQGLVELLIALTLLSVAVAGLLAVYASSDVSLGHSRTEGTALTVASRQVEVYSAIPYSCIALNAGSAPTGCPAPASFPNEYAPDQTVSGSDTPDHRTYTVHTDISTVSGEKQVTVSVSSSAGVELARVQSLFSSLAESTS